MTTLYSIRSTPADDEFLITKFDRDYNPEGTYALTTSNCSCPAGQKPTCRHRKMLPFFTTTRHIDDGWFFDYDTRQWRRPLLTEFDLSPPKDTYEERVAAFAKSFESEGANLSLPQQDLILTHAPAPNPNAEP